MDNVWNILKKELQYFGIALSDSNKCSIEISGKWQVFSIDKIKSILRKRIHENGKFFEETWKELIELFQYQKSSQIKEPIDDLILNVFTKNIKELADFSSFLADNFDFIDSDLKTKIVIETREAVDRDINNFPKEIINKIIDYKMILDYSFNKMSNLAYAVKLLRISQKGFKKLSNFEIKTAIGISGPWANLDLPMQERTYQWEEIDEDMRGRTKDKRMQRRYQQGLEDYNNEKASNYWREMKNEPYSWADRNTESPYPSRNTLMNWG